MTADYARLAAANKINAATFWSRIRRGWTLERAVTQPIQVHHFDWEPEQHRSAD